MVAGAAALTLRSVPACAGGAASSALAAETEGINLLAPSAPCDSSAADQAEFDGLSARDVGPWLFKRALRECSRGHSTDSGYSWREVAGTMSLIAARNGSEGKAFTRTNVQHYLGRLSRDRAASRTPRPGAARARSQAQHARAQLQLAAGPVAPDHVHALRQLESGLATPTGDVDGALPQWLAKRRRTVSSTRIRRFDDPDR